MKLKTSKILLITLFLGWTIYLCFRIHNLKQEIETLKQTTRMVPDTVFINKPFIPKSLYDQEIEPSRIQIFDNFKNTFAINNDSSKSSSPQVIEKSDSLVQFLLKKDQLSLSQFNKPTSTYSTREFRIDLENYDYNWYQGHLTQNQKKSLTRLTFKPYAYGKYRPVNTLFDIGSGISIKTTRFNYKLGINLFWYPNIQRDPGIDLEFSLSYNF